MPGIIHSHLLTGMISSSSVGWAVGEPVLQIPILTLVFLGYSWYHLCYSRVSEKQTARQDRMCKNFIRGKPMGKKWTVDLGRLSELSDHNISLSHIEERWKEGWVEGS